MGDISVMARRLHDGGVQYGWSGNGGYCQNTGLRLISWYNTPEKVEYLFNLGQTGRIGKPGSENGADDWYYSHELTGRPCWQGKSEREIFSKINFIDYGYFYDSDNTWYYIIPGPYRIKIPLEYITDYMKENDCDFEFDYLDEIKQSLLVYMFVDYYNENPEFREFLTDNIGISANNILLSLLKDKFPVEYLYHNYRIVYNYFDDWVVVGKKDGQFTFKIKKDEESHIETIEW